MIVISHGSPQNTHLASYSRNYRVKILKTVKIVECDFIAQVYEIFFLHIFL